MPARVAHLVGPLWSVVLLAGCYSVEPAGRFDEESAVASHAEGTVVVQVTLEGRSAEVWLPSDAARPDGPGRAERQPRADGVVAAEVSGVDLSGGVQRLDGRRLALLPPSMWDGRVVIPDLRPGIYAATLTRRFYEPLTVEGVRVGFADKVFVGPRELRRTRVRVQGRFLLAADDEGGAVLPDRSEGISVRLASTWAYCLSRPVPEEDDRVATRQGEVHGCPAACVQPSAEGPNEDPTRCLERRDRAACVVPLCRPAASRTDVETRRRCADPAGSPPGVGWEACGLTDEWEVTTDPSGQFAIPDVPDGREYHLVASKAGYGTVHLLLRGDGAARVDPGEEADAGEVDEPPWYDVSRSFPGAERTLRPHGRYLVLNGGGPSDPASTSSRHVAVEVPPLPRPGGTEDPAHVGAEYLRLSESESFSDEGEAAGLPDAVATRSCTHTVEGVQRTCFPEACSRTPEHQPARPAAPSELIPLADETSRCFVLPLSALPPDLQASGRLARDRCGDDASEVCEGERGIYGAALDPFGASTWRFSGRVVYDRTPPSLHRLVVEEPDGRVTQVFPCDEAAAEETDWFQCRGGRPEAFWTRHESIRLKAWGADVWSPPGRLALRVRHWATQWSESPLVYPAAVGLDLGGEEPHRDSFQPVTVELADAAENLGEAIQVQVCSDTAAPPPASRPTLLGADRCPAGRGLEGPDRDGRFHTACGRVQVAVDGGGRVHGCGADVARSVVTNELLGETPCDADDPPGASAACSADVPLVPGTNALYASVWDHAGHESPPGPTVEVEYDNVPPVLSGRPALGEGCTTLSGDTYYSRAPNEGCTLDAVLAFSDDVEDLHYTVDGANPCAIRGNLPTVQRPLESPNLLALLPQAEGRQTLRLCAVDRAGNRSAPLTFRLFLDVSLPEAPSVQGTTGEVRQGDDVCRRGRYLHDGAVPVRIDATDGPDGTGVVELRGEGFSLPYSRFATIPVEGSGSPICLRAVDAVGNVSEEGCTEPIYVDDEGPVLRPGPEWLDAVDLVVASDHETWVACIGTSVPPADTVRCGPDWCHDVGAAPACRLTEAGNRRVDGDAARCRAELVTTGRPVGFRAEDCAANWTYCEFYCRCSAERGCWWELDYGSCN